jgi:hypothetical protein
MCKECGKYCGEKDSCFNASVTTQLSFNERQPVLPCWRPVLRPLCFTPRLFGPLLLLLRAGTFLHFALRSLLPQSGPGRWCSWGPDRDLPAVFNNCGGGDPGPDHVALFEATRRVFTRNCSGITGHQDVAYFDAVGVDYGRTLTLTALRHPVERVISAYYYSLRVNAPFLEGYRPANDTDFSGLLRFVADNPARGNNLMTLVLAGARHCAWPGIAPAPPEAQWLAAAKRNLARVCVLVLAVSNPCCLAPRANQAWRSLPPSSPVLSPALHQSWVVPPCYPSNHWS